MCGRFTQSYTWRELVELYRLTQPARNSRPRYNIAPTTAIDVVRLARSGRELVRALGPHSRLVEKDGDGSAFDVQRTGRDGRAKADFRSAFKRSRCIVPASGYYEWRAAESYAGNWVTG